MRKSILMVSALMLLMACGSKKSGSDDAAAADSTSVKDTTAVADSLQAVADEATADDEDAIDELVFVPDLKNDKPLNLSDVKDDVEKYIPYWNEEDVYQEDEEEGVIRYNLNLGYDLNGDKHTDALVCLGRYGVNKNLYYDAYLWDSSCYYFTLVENFREIPNPGIDKKTSNITSHIGSDREIWLWKGKDKTKIEKRVETRERD